MCRVFGIVQDALGCPPHQRAFRRAAYALQVARSRSMLQAMYYAIMQSDQTERFIEAVESIKGSYEKIYKKSFKGFGEAWRYALEKGHSVALQNRDLGIVIGNLRNSISHSGYKNGVPIAIPRVDIVEKSERISELVRHPATIKKFIDRDTISLNPNSPLSEIAKVISENDFSQIPICDNNKVVNLLTTNTISRWLSSSIDENGEIYEDAGAVTAAELLSYAESIDTPKYVKPNRPAYEVCKILSGDTPTSAVIVTQSGESNSPLMGIVTASDVPTILRKLEVR